MNYNLLISNQRSLTGLGQIMCNYRRGGMCIVLASVAFLGLTCSKSKAAVGFVTYQADKTKDPDAMSANDFRKILDKSLGDKFSDLILIFGGCFSADFTTAMKDGTAAKSQKNFAFLSSTGQTGSCFAEGDVTGNYFLQGIAQGFSLNPVSGEHSTVGQAIDSAQKKAKDKGATHTNQTDANKNAVPEIFPNTAQAKNITLGKGATSYHAILFGGEPKVCADWVDVLSMYNALLASGYKPQDIKVLFGSGKRSPYDSSPVLEDGKSALQHKNNVEAEKHCDYNGVGGYDKYNEATDADGHPIKTVDFKAATYANLQKALEELGPISENSATEQYVIWTGTHNTAGVKDLITELPKANTEKVEKHPKKQVTKKSTRKHARREVKTPRETEIGSSPGNGAGGIRLGIGIGIGRLGGHDRGGEGRSLADHGGRN